MTEIAFSRSASEKFEYSTSIALSTFIFLGGFLALRGLDGEPSWLVIGIGSGGFGGRGSFYHSENCPVKMNGRNELENRKESNPPLCYVALGMWRCAENRIRWLGSSADEFLLGR